jgi:hypothetical protein
MINKFFANSKYNTFAIFLILLALISYLAPTRNEQVKITYSYPATVCPAITANANAIAGLPNSKIGKRLIDGKIKKFSPANASSLALGTKSILIDGNAGTALAFVNNGWKAVVPCSVSNGEQWFVGGSGSLTSKDVLYIVNSGFSESTVEVEVYTPNAALDAKQISISPNSTKSISVDTLAPGEDSLVIAVKTKSGRVSSFLFDERKKGLRSLGADYVAPVSAPNKLLTIPAISDLQGKAAVTGSTSSHVLRLIIPGSIDANIEVSINSNDGNFVPVGLSELKVKSRRVVNIPLSFAPQKQAFSIIVKSDQPALASVLSSYTIGKSSEIAWATSTESLDKLIINLTGSKPLVAFAGTNINVTIQAIGSNGKKFNKTIKGSNFAIWQAPIGLNRIQFVSKNPNTHGGIILQPEGGGVGASYIPLNAGANLESTSEPISDADVISRG